MDNASLELIQRIAQDIDLKVYKEIPMEQHQEMLQFKSQLELDAAQKILKPMFIFRVYSIGKLHYLIFRSETDARLAAQALRENYANANRIG